MLGLAFSKNRAMQLDAMLRSFKLHCSDYDGVEFNVTCKATTEQYGRQYHSLSGQYNFARLFDRSDFHSEILSLLQDHRGGYVLFAVDDNMFIKPFSLSEVTQALAENSDALGFSLRLGLNTTYCYPYDRAQAVPSDFNVANGKGKFNWTRGEGDFGYPLEISSSVYRVNDLLPVLKRLPFTDPNTMESYMNSHANQFKGSHPYLLCYAKSRAFCNPVNIVQSVYPGNRRGSNEGYSPQRLAELFDQGSRVDVSAYSSLEPSACHQEAELVFKEGV